MVFSSSAVGVSVFCSFLSRLSPLNGPMTQVFASCSPLCIVVIGMSSFVLSLPINRCLILVAVGLSNCSRTKTWSSLSGKKVVFSDVPWLLCVDVAGGAVLHPMLSNQPSTQRQKGHHRREKNAFAIFCVTQARCFSAFFAPQSRAWRLSHIITTGLGMPLCAMIARHQILPPTRGSM